MQLQRIPCQAGVRAIHLTSDAPDPITPGALCREALIGMLGDLTIPVIMKGKRGGVYRASLGELYPHPPLFRGVARAAVKGLAQELASRTEYGDAHDNKWLELIDRTVAAASAHSDGRIGDGLHPIHLAAGVMFTDGHIEVSAQLKAVEYGCSVDPLVKIVHTIEKHDHSAHRLVLVDQFGNLHPPFATARSFLSENPRLSQHLHILCQNLDGDTFVVDSISLLPSTPSLQLSKSQL